MECKMLSGHSEYHRCDDDHILISCKNYYNNYSCMLNFILTVVPEDKPQVMTRESASALIKVLIENKNGKNYPVIFVESDSSVIREVYIFVMNNFCGQRFEPEPTMNIYSLLESVWQESFRNVVDKKWNKRTPKRFVDVATK